MWNPEGESDRSPLRPCFDRRLKLEFHGSRVTSDALLAYRELDDALRLTALAGDVLADSRTGKNGWHGIVGLLRQSVYGRLAGYEDVNDAERANDENLAALADLSGVWIDRVHARKLPRMIVLDMDNSVSPTHGDQEGTAYNGHFGCTCYHPLFVFNQFGDLERCGFVPATCTAPTSGAMCWNRWSLVTATGHSGVTSVATPPSPHPKSTSFSKPRTSATPSGSPQTRCCKAASPIC